MHDVQARANHPFRSRYRKRFRLLRISPTGVTGTNRHSMRDCRIGEDNSKLKLGGGDRPIPYEYGIRWNTITRASRVRLEERTRHERETVDRNSGGPLKEEAVECRLMTNKIGY